MKMFSTVDSNNIWDISSNKIWKLVEEITFDLNTPEYRRPSRIDEEEHFENGHFLHSSQYYFAKKYFQSSNNCDKLAQLLAIKIKQLDIKNVTLIGFRSYIGLLLSKTQKILSLTDYSVDYVLIEQMNENEFTWQTIPDMSKLNENFLIVLPITCSCSTYIRLKKYLDGQILILKKEYTDRKPNLKYNWNVNSNFINIFLILEESLQKTKKPVIVDKEKLSKIKAKENVSVNIVETNLSNLYSGFNWERIEDNAIYLKKFPHTRPKNIKSNYIGHPLVKLYSKLYLSEECPLCFPDKGKLALERNIFPTHDNFETPNLLIGFPNIDIQSYLKTSTSYPIKQKPYLFNDIFTSTELLGNSHLYGHIKAHGISYLHYIRGNTFYKHNKEDILEFFNAQLERIFAEKSKLVEDFDIVFITSESKHNSIFLDEIVTDKVLSSKNSSGNFKFNVHILRIDSNNEFIDNFMTNYNSLILNSQSIITIYFEEVISTGRTCKLVSNYIKHYNVSQSSYPLNRNGFNYIFSLIDRTPFFTRAELIEKLYSPENKEPENNFISFFKLNVPVVAAVHLGNPLQENVSRLKNMILESQLDLLKAKIGSELQLSEAIELPEENILINRMKKINYFPFENNEEEITIELFDLYSGIITNGKLDLLKLYIAHQINTILSTIGEINIQNHRLDERLNGNFIQSIITTIWDEIVTTGETFFTLEVHSKYRVVEIEKEIVHDTIIKILSRQPFTYYKEIYDSIFKYCLGQMEELRNSIMVKHGEISFRDIRKCKFYIRRLVDLDSSYLISNDFILLLKLLYEEDYESQCSKISKISNKYKKMIELENNSSCAKSNLLFNTIIGNMYYKYNQINSLSIFLFFLYKKSIFKNHYRSIRLEQLLYSEELFPKEIVSVDNSIEATLRLLRDSYYHLTRIVKEENIYLLNELKKLHIRNYSKYLKAENEFDELQYEISPIEKDRLKKKMKNDWPFSTTQDISKYYFNNKRNDPVILNARKFIEKSRFAINSNENQELLKLSIAEMLHASTLFIKKRSIANYTNSKADKTLNHDLINEIRVVIQSVVKIIQHGIETIMVDSNEEKIEIIPGSRESKLKYALCYEYMEGVKYDSIANDIFVISPEDSDIASRLDSKGLICNLLDGLYTNIENHNSISERKDGLQSFLVSVKIEDKYVSFNEGFNVISQSNDYKFINFDELYKKDCKYSTSGMGLSILNDAPMSLFFRLSESNIKNLSNEKLNIKGRAILIVTFNSEPNKTNFLSFMNINKIRLLLLIKEEFLLYLRNKFESDAFNELLQFRLEKEHKDSMGHMVKDYWRAMQYYLDLKTLNTQDIDLIKFIKLKIQTHLTAKNVILDYDPSKYPEYDEEKFKEVFKNLMMVPYLSHLKYRPDEYNLSVRIDNPIKCHHVVFEQVIAELIINMRRAADKLVDDDFPEFKIYTENNNLFFVNKNNSITNPDPKFVKKNGGKEMCMRILKKLGLEWEEEIISPNIYQFKIILTPKR